MQTVTAGCRTPIGETRNTGFRTVEFQEYSTRYWSIPYSRSQYIDDHDHIQGHQDRCTPHNYQEQKTAANKEEGKDASQPSSFEALDNLDWNEIKDL